MTKLNSKSWKEKKDIERKESFTSFRTFQIEKKYNEKEKYLNTERKAQSR